MKYKRQLTYLIPLIAVLSLFAAGVGVFYQTPGEPYPFTSVRGEQVTINGRGIYGYDTVSSTAQMQANDLITLVLGLPLLVIATLLAFRDDPRSAWPLRGRLLLTGTLGFFLYTYMSMATNTAFNNLFPVYVTLFSLSLYAFIMAMMSFDLAGLPGRFSEHLPRGWIAGLLIFAGAFLTLAWLGGRVLPPILQGTMPLLENCTTMVIQTMDLGLLVPLAFLAGILLLRRNAWGYLLSAVVVMKMLTMGVAVSTMGINMARNGTPDSPVIVGIFIGITLVNIVLAVFLLKDVRAEGEAVGERYPLAV
ncbi:MAG: hypothetical protein EHM21_07870 [Chloroflexi bacterium]|nr:MAG: hypothetical protein EHM21_07870 [Chloroflexota bacterium]